MDQGLYETTMAIEVKFIAGDVSTVNHTKIIGIGMWKENMDGVGQRGINVNGSYRPILCQ